MTDTRRRTGFAEKTKPCRFITEISFTDDFQSHRAVQIDVERLVSDPHRAATQLERFPVFTGHQLVVLKSFRWLVRCRPECIPRRRLAGLNSIPPENSLPQLGQVRWGPVLTDLTVLRLRSALRKTHGSSG